MNEGEWGSPRLRSPQRPPPSNRCRRQAAEGGGPVIPARHRCSLPPPVPTYSRRWRLGAPTRCAVARPVTAATPSSRRCRCSLPPQALGRLCRRCPLRAGRFPQMRRGGVDFLCRRLPPASSPNTAARALVAETFHPPMQRIAGDGVGEEVWCAASERGRGNERRRRIGGE
jgi:hypothetical protein